ncbi:MAG: MarR family transcriptional regulator [Desulfobacteraceae bacterium]|jgi:MarR family 2-MHQ and catechol resistance regulon transcriptional repressor
MAANAAKDLSMLIREITWNFGARGLKGECCGDLSQPEFRALCLASERQQCSMQDIAKDLGFTKGGATRVVNRLEKKGYIERQRSREDGRVCCVKVTAPGSMLVKTVNREKEDRITKIMASVDPGMQEVIKTALQSFVQAMRIEE